MENPESSETNAPNGSTNNHRGIPECRDCGCPAFFIECSLIQSCLPRGSILPTADGSDEALETLSDASKFTQVKGQVGTSAQTTQGLYVTCCVSHGPAQIHPGWVSTKDRASCGWRSTLDTEKPSCDHCAQQTDMCIKPLRKTEF